MAVAKTIAIAAAAVLAQYTEDEAVHVCEDGQTFRSRNLAELHSKAEKMAAPITVTRGEVSDELDAIAGRKNGKAKDAGKISEGSNDAGKTTDAGDDIGKAGDDSDDAGKAKASDSGKDNKNGKGKK